jgi:Uma2 family endonuclease
MPMDLVGIEKSASIRIEPPVEKDARMSPEEFFQFCRANSEWQIERSAEGEILIMPPEGFDSGYYEVEIVAQLRNWARRDGRGRAFGPSTGFILANGAMLAPDAAWVSNERASVLTPAQRRKFAPVCPEFVVEMKSPSDSLPRLKRKMKEWIENGAELAWLILPDDHTVLVFRPDSAIEVVEGAATIGGEGPVRGFELDMIDIWS